MEDRERTASYVENLKKEIIDHRLDFKLNEIEGFINWLIEEFDFYCYQCPNDYEGT
jgi:hypothetical protein